MLSLLLNEKLKFSSKTPFLNILIDTYSLDITCGFSILYSKLSCSSAWNELRGDNVPEVKIIDLGFRAWISLKPIPALKHQNPKTLVV